LLSFQFIANKRLNLGNSSTITFKKNEWIETIFKFQRWLGDNFAASFFLATNRLLYWHKAS
jgi:hypothetical protein